MQIENISSLPIDKIFDFYHKTEGINYNINNLKSEDISSDILSNYINESSSN